MFNILVYKQFKRLNQDGTKLDTFSKWLGLAGLDNKCKKIQPIPSVTMWYDIRLASSEFLMNVDVCMAEMVRLTCQGLFKAFNSFTWLSDINIMQLIGTTSNNMIKGRELNLALVSSEIFNYTRARTGNKMPLGELYNVLSKLTSGKQDNNLFYGMSDSLEWLFADGCMFTG